VGFAVVVEADRGSSDASASHDGKGVVGLFACHEKARRGLGTWDVNILTAQEGEHVGTVWTPFGF
jgi:hypothetical protein